MQKVRFIYNPSSGLSSIIVHLDRLIELYQESGFILEPYRLNFQSNARNILEGVTSDYHHILISGGDGTLNYVVNELKASSIDLPIAIIPTGTANDFSTMLGLSEDVEKCARQILSGVVREVDLGYVNGSYFVNVFSCGLFTDVSQKTPTFWKNNFGKIAYYVGGIGELPRFRKMELVIETDGGDFEGKALIFFVFNGRTAGNLPIAYLSEVDDGLLDVLIVRGDTAVETLRAVMKYVSPIAKRKTYPKGIVHFRCSRLTARALRNEHTDVDGQPGPKFPLIIECSRSALKVIVPQER